MASSTTTLTCPISDCNWRYESTFGVEQSFQLISMHVDREHAAQPQVVASTAKAPKLCPPKIDAGVDLETWQAFQIRWKQYCQGSQLSQESQSLQLFQCASEALGNLLIQYHGADITDNPPEVVMRALEELAVIPAAKGITRAELMRMSQGSDEPIRTFAAKVQGKAQICGFQMESRCSCNLTIDYTQEVVKDVILAGIADNEIRMGVLDVEDIEGKSVNAIVALIERKEKARKAYGSTGVSAMSSFKRSQSAHSSNLRKLPPSQTPKIPCPRCRRPYRRFNGRNNKAFEICFECNRKPSKQKATALKNALVGAERDDEDDVDVALVQTTHTVSGTDVLNRRDILSNICNNVTLLCNISIRDHPRINLRISPIGKPHVVSVVGIADTGAQTNIWGLSDFLSAGFDRSMLQSSLMKITAANRHPIPIIGGMSFHVEGDGHTGWG